MPPTKVPEPSLDFRGWWSPLFGAAGLIIPLFIQTEKHVLQRCTPCNALALQTLLSPGRWGHAYLPDEVELDVIEVQGKPATNKRNGNYQHALYTADRLTLYGDGFHRAVCEFIITETVHGLREGYYPYAQVTALFGVDDEPVSPDIFREISKAMRAIIAVYEAEECWGPFVVPEEGRSVWTNEHGLLINDVSRPWRYTREDMNAWAASCLWAAGGSVRKTADESVIFMWKGCQHDMECVHWWFQRVGYSPTTDWQSWAKIVLAASESATKGGLISAKGPFLEKRDRHFSSLDLFVRAILNATQVDFRVFYDVEPASECIAGVTLTFLAKLVISLFCTFVTAGGPWLVIWLTTLLTRWSIRDIGTLRQGAKCSGRGYHLHSQGKCLIKFLQTPCITSAGSEHSRVYGLLAAAAGWGLANALYLAFPNFRGLVAVQQWDASLGFAMGNALLVGACLVGLLTMSYKLPKHPYQRYFWWRMGLEWILAIGAIVAGMTPAMVIGEVNTRWMLTAEGVAWLIDGFVTLFVIGTYPDCITSWHSVWVLVPALLSLIGGTFGYFNSRYSTIFRT